MCSSWDRRSSSRLARASSCRRRRSRRETSRDDRGSAAAGARRHGRRLEEAAAAWSPHSGSRSVILSDSAIKRPVLTVVAMLILVIFGVFALAKLEVDEFPQIDAPVVTVLVPYPGAAPDQVERDVIDPLEEQFTALSGIDKVQSKAVD